MIQRFCAFAFLSIFIFSSSILALESKEGLDVSMLLATSTSWNGSRLPSYPNSHPELKLVRVVLAPGAVIPWHKHPGISAAFITSGKVRVRSEGATEIVLAAGDPMVELVDQWHYGESIGSEPAEILVVFLAEKNKPLTVFKKNSQRAIIKGSETLK